MLILILLPVEPVHASSEGYETPWQPEVAPDPWCDECGAERHDGETCRGEAVYS